MKNYDVAVVGAGVFGSWTAFSLARAGQKVLLLDAHGAGNSRASSGGESRIIRMGYGKDEIYTRWSMRSIDLWREFAAQAGRALFHRTGVLWMAGQNDQYTSQTLETLKKLNVPHEKLSVPDLKRKFPQISFDGVAWGLLEPESGALLARQAVQLLAAECRRQGVEYKVAAIQKPKGNRRLESIVSANGGAFSCERYVFACGPWLGKIFPELLGQKIIPSRQEVFFFGVPSGSESFSPPAMPTWINLSDEAYGVPDLEGRGFKVAFDTHGEEFDPESGQRVVSAEAVKKIRDYVARRFPELRDAPVIESRVCQYENTSNGDFLIDRHPDFDNVWLVGGGSGHGFKHGPALGEYVTKLITKGGTTEARFSLATKGELQKRAVY
ncbi:MAG: FAD-dependent oxidoreductase [Acidobacteriales bacterium]|nr:FAD-dependent oxidoreductase [Terriglobales bacterium]